MEWRNALMFYTTNKIGFFMMVGVMIGIALGGGLKVIEKDLTPRHIMYIGFPSEILIQMLEAIGVPLFVVSLAITFASLEKGISTLIRLELLLYCLSTKIFTAAMSILLALAVKPGKGHERSKDIPEISYKESMPFTIEEDNVLDLVRNAFPDNWILTSMERSISKISYNATEDKLSFGLDTTEPANIIGLISVSVVVGVSMRMVKHGSQAFMDFLTCVLNVLLIIFRWMYFITPALLISLTARETIRVGPISFITAVCLYVVVWVICIIIQVLIYYPLLYLAFVRRNPFVFYKLLRKDILGALRTSSTREISDSLRSTLKEDCELNSRIVDSVLPMTLLLNKDGCCVHMGIAYILTAEYSGIPLHVHHYITVFYLTLMGSVAVVGIPQGTLMFMTAFLRGATIPVYSICILFTVDWLLDRFCTFINMLGTALGMAILDSFNTDIPPQEAEEEEGRTDENEEELNVQQYEAKEQEV